MSEPRSDAARDGAGLAFKAYEIEELADVYFFRPVGFVFAQAARRLHLTPTFVTLASMAAGLAGGALLYDARTGGAAVVLILIHSILDSSDGQLARLTGRSSEFGRLLDGISGFVTHIAVYAAILAGALEQGAGVWLAGVALLAACANVVHAQLYDYHRGAYTRVVLQGAARGFAVAGESSNGVVRAYERMEARLAGRHPVVERAIAERARDGQVATEDRQRVPPDLLLAGSRVEPDG